MEKSVIEKMDTALRRPVPYEGLKILESGGENSHAPRPGAAVPANDSSKSGTSETSQGNGPRRIKG